MSSRFVSLVVLVVVLFFALRWFLRSFAVFLQDYTGQTKVALLETQTHVNPYPLESYIEIPGAVWAVIFHPGKPYVNII